MRNKSLKFAFMFLTLASLTLHSPPADAGILSFLKNLFSIFKDKLSSGGSGGSSGGGYSGGSSGGGAYDDSDPSSSKLDIKEYCPDGSENPEFAAQKYIKSLADSSGANCATYRWSERGVAPTGYVSGMALVFAKKVCETDDEGGRVIASQPAQSSSKDALAHYGKKGSLINTYTLLIGLGMRESSGKLCEGRDQSATNTSASTAEAGMFQTSWNSNSASPEIRNIFNEYKTGSKQCFKETFSKGVKCRRSDGETFGSGEGAEFQQMSKHCPAFAAEIAAVNIRVNRRHYGPLNTRKAEFRTGCMNMLTAVQEAIVQNPQLCDGLVGKTEGRTIASTGEQGSSCSAQNSSTTTPDSAPAQDDSGTAGTSTTVRTDGGSSDDGNTISR